MSIHTLTPKSFDLPLPDKRPTTGLSSWLPAQWVPYSQLMRIERPAGLYAFYVPYLIGLAYAASSSAELVDPFTLLTQVPLILFGCIILRGATCTWNDNMDQDFDRQVERCKSRPIARGAVSTTQAHLFTLGLTAVGASLMRFWPKSCAFDAAVMYVLLMIYPFGKRYTNYPQFILGFPFAGAIMFSCHALGLDPYDELRLSPTLCICAANILWTMTYDTIYAHQDLKDDVAAGVKGMAVRFANSTKLLSTILSIGQVALLIKAGYDLDLGLPYYLVGCFGTALAMTAMIVLVDLSRPESCAWWFKADFFIAGGTMTGGFLAEYLVKLVASM